MQLSILFSLLMLSLTATAQLQMINTGTPGSTARQAYTISNANDTYINGRVDSLRDNMGGGASGNFWNTDQPTTLTTVSPSTNNVINIPTNTADAFTIWSNNGASSYMKWNTNTNAGVITFGKNTALPASRALVLKYSHQPTSAAAFDDLAIPTKKYVLDNAVTSGNGMTKVGSALNWGGTVNGDVTLAPGSTGTGVLQFGDLFGNKFDRLYFNSNRAHFYLANALSDNNGVFYVEGTNGGLASFDRNAVMGINNSATNGFYITDLTSNQFLLNMNKSTRTFSTWVNDGGSITSRIVQNPTSITFDAGDINLTQAPTNDNTLTQILARDATTGEIKYRNASSFSAGGSFWNTSGNTNITAGATITLPSNESISALDYKWADATNGTNYFMRFRTLEDDFFSGEGPAIVFGSDNILGGPLLLKATHQPTDSWLFDDLTYVTKKYVDDAAIDGASIAGSGLQWNPGTSKLQLSQNSGIVTSSINFTPSTAGTLNFLAGSSTGNAFNAFNVRTSNQAIFYMPSGFFRVSGNATSFALDIDAETDYEITSNATPTIGFSVSRSGTNTKILRMSDNGFSVTHGTTVSDISGIVLDNSQFTVTVGGSGAQRIAATTSGVTLTGTISLPSTTSIGTVSNTELAFVDGVTSSIQTQFGNKANLTANTFTGKQTMTPNATNAGLNTGSFAGDPSTLTNGDVWYNSSTGKLMGRAGGTSVDLGASGGGGTTETASNGLTKVGDDIQLGGYVTGNIILEGTGAESFAIGDLDGFDVVSGYANSFNFTTPLSHTISNDATHALFSNNSQVLELNSSGINVTLNTGDTFKASSDYSSNFVNESYVTKRWSLAAKTFTGKQTMITDATNAGLNVGPFAGDPSSTTVGDFWFNSTDGAFKGRYGVQDETFIHTNGGLASAFSVIYAGNATTGQVASDADMTYNAVTNSLTVPRVILSPTATRPGLSIGSLAGDPSSLANGDMWYNSSTNELKARINGSSVALGAGGGGAAWGSITGTLSSQTDLQSALDAKQATLVSGTNIKTINGSSVLGSGNLSVSDSRITTAVLASDHGNSTTTGTEVALGATLGAGLYTYEYYILAQSSVATTGINFGINFTGTSTLAQHTLTFPTSGTTTANGTGDNSSGGITAQLSEAVTGTSFSTTTPLLTTLGVAAINANVLYRISGTILVTVSGDLELWHSSETAASTTVKANSSLIVTKVN